MLNARLKLSVFFCSLMYLGLGAALLPAQTVQENEQGEQIIQFEDGSWRYFEPEDSVLLQPTELQQIEQKISESESHLKKLSAKLDLIRERTFNLQKAQKNNRYNRAIYQSEIDSLDREDEDLRRLVKSLELELEKMILQKSALQSTTNLPPPSQKNFQQKKTKKPQRSLYAIPHYSQGGESPCNIQKTKIPESDGVRLASKQEKWFYYTPSLLEYKYPDQPYITGYVSVLNDGDIYYLQLQIEIRDLEAVSDYGWVNKEAPLFLLTMSEKTLEIQTEQEAIGQKDSQAGLTQYTLLYSLSPDQFRQLRQEEISKIRLVWSSGYEDYEIYRIRFLQKQIACLESNVN